MTKGLGVFVKGGKVMLLYLFNKQKKPELKLAKSKDGVNFQPTLRKPILVKTAGIAENLKKCDDFHAYKTAGHFVLNYSLSLRKKKIFNQAVSKNLIKWKKIKKPLEHKKGEIEIVDYRFKGQKVKYLSREGKIYKCLMKSTDKSPMSFSPAALRW